MWDNHEAPPDNTNPILDKQIQDQQAEIAQKRQDLSAERIRIIRSHSQSWEPGSINPIRNIVKPAPPVMQPSGDFTGVAGGNMGAGKVPGYVGKQ